MQISNLLGWEAVKLQTSQEVYLQNSGLYINFIKPESKSRLITRTGRYTESQFPREEAPNYHPLQLLFCS